MKSKPPRAVILVGCLILLLTIIANLPFLFAAMTLFLSVKLFGRVERDKALHEVSFYLARPPSPRLLRFLKAWSIGEVAAKSALFGALPLFLFGGTNEDRIGTLGFVFVLSVLATYLVLRRVESLAGLDILRWGYLRLSLVAGVVFSLIASLVPGMGLGGITKSVGKQTFSQLGFHEIIELTYGLLYQINSFISSALISLLGPIGWLISLVLSTHVIYGFIVLLYALLLIRILPAASVAPAIDATGA